MLFTVEIAKFVKWRFVINMLSVRMNRCNRCSIHYRPLTCGKGEEVNQFKIR